MIENCCLPLFTRKQRSLSGASVNSTPRSPPLEKYTPITTPTTPDIVCHDEILVDDVEIPIDENVSKVKNEYVFKNGFFAWMDKTPMYLINTGYNFEGNDIYIQYRINGKFEKRMGYFQNGGTEFIECVFN